MNNNLNQIIVSLFEAIEAQEKTIKDLTKQVHSLREVNDTRLYRLESVNPTSDTIQFIIKTLLEAEAI